jgi:urea carboxylase
MDAKLDGRPVPFWEPIAVPRGSVLALGPIRGAGQRACLAVRGGIDVPEYLGSRATFTLGQFGGHGGRALRTGDVLRLNRSGADLGGCHAIGVGDRPNYVHAWQIAVTDGPHGAPDFFTPADIETFFAAD